MNMPDHEASICTKRGKEVKCTNAGCTEILPAKSMLVAHKATDCLYEMVDCPFTTLGCDVQDLMRKDIDDHNASHAQQHNNMLMRSIQSLQQGNQSLQQKVAELSEGNKSLQQQLDDARERQHHKIVLSINVASMVEGDDQGVQPAYSNSPTKVVGAYNVFLNVRKGFPDNADTHIILFNRLVVGQGDYCGMFLHFEDGPFPCHVNCSFEVVKWGQGGLSEYKKEFSHTYETVEGFGCHQMVPLSKLTDATSPYVKDGQATFIATFRIIPLV